MGTAAADMEGGHADPINAVQAGIERWREKTVARNPWRVVRLAANWAWCFGAVMFFIPINDGEGNGVGVEPQQESSAGIAPHGGESIEPIGLDLLWG